MTFRLALPVILVLAACTQPPAQRLDPAGYVPLDHSLPFAARTLLPRGVAEVDARVRDGCYAYVYQGQLYALQRPDGGQYCIG